VRGVSRHRRDGRGPAAGGRHQELGHAQPLVVAQLVELAAEAEHHQRVGTTLDEVLDAPLEADLVDLTGLAKWRRDDRQHPPEPLHRVPSRRLSSRRSPNPESSCV
jgi:hypothetical protein